MIDWQIDDARNWKRKYYLHHFFLFQDFPYQQIMIIYKYHITARRCLSIKLRILSKNSSIMLQPKRKKVVVLFLLAHVLEFFKSGGGIMSVLPFGAAVICNSHLKDSERQTPEGVPLTNSPYARKFCFSVRFLTFFLSFFFRFRFLVYCDDHRKFARFVSFDFFKKYEPDHPNRGIISYGVDWLSSLTHKFITCIYYPLYILFTKRRMCVRLIDRWQRHLRYDILENQKFVVKNLLLKKL